MAIRCGHGCRGDNLNLKGLEEGSFIRDTRKEGRNGRTGEEGVANPTSPKKLIDSHAGPNQKGEETRGKTVVKARLG